MRTRKSKFRTLAYDVFYTIFDFLFKRKCLTCLNVNKSGHRIIYNRDLHGQVSLSPLGYVLVVAPILGYDNKVESTFNHEL